MSKNSQIYVNQLGYVPGFDKYFITTLDSISFKILSIKNTVVYSGIIEEWKDFDISTGEKLKIGRFSDFNSEGLFKIILDSGEESFKFEIRDNLYSGLSKIVLKSYEFQRCGTELLEADFGEFHRRACHTGTALYHPSLGIKGGKDVTGGWHDAGDYGRYITPGAVTVATMMLGYEQFPDKIKNSPKYIEEIKYELDWMLKMQETNSSSNMFGGVHYMVNFRDYAWEVPDKDRSELFITGYCSIATADFSATMALASRIFRSLDREYSDVLLKRSILAWKFIKEYGEYPLGGFVRPIDMYTGGYADNPKDNRFTNKDMAWPAVELFLTTGDDEYNMACKTLLNPETFISTGGLNWMDKSVFSEVQYIFGKSSNFDRQIKRGLVKNFLSRCDSYVEISDNDGFFSTLKEQEYQWGSNGEILSRSFQLILAYEKTKDKKYIESALKQVNYILGLNINGMSFLTGVGSNSSKNIHHASFANDGINKGFPGIMAGGANRMVEADPALKAAKEPGTPGAKCYVDHEDSYSSNENCITYSAPLVPICFYFSTL